MNFFKWEFSKEVQPELNKFLEVVIQNENEETTHEEIFTQMFPELKQNQTESNNFEDDDVIVIEDENMETIQDKITEISVLNITQSTNKKPDENILNPDVYDFIKTIREFLETEECELENEYITNKLVNDFDNYTLQYLFSNLVDISEQGLYNLNQIICQHADMKIIPELFCKSMLSLKVHISEPSKYLLIIMNEFSEKFPSITRTELLLPFLIQNNGNVKLFKIIINKISDTEKQLLLRDFVYFCNELEHCQLLPLQCLMSSNTEDVIKRRLINLMDVSADKFKNEKLFLNLLIMIIQILESSFEDQEETLFNIIEKNKTVFKVSALKELKKWINNFNNE